MTNAPNKIAAPAFQLHLLVDSARTTLPTQSELVTWATLALNPSLKDHSELSVQIVDSDKSAELNERYRTKAHATNVLSFPYRGPSLPAYRVYGDLVLCAPVIETEAQQHNIALLEHWAHIFIHGCLHLIGYDHVNDEDATEMETKEIALLETLNISNPYL